MTPLYSLRNLRRRFGDRTVLDIDSLDIEPHRIYSLLGANGAGKSTLMRILAFLDAPSEGDLLFRGRRVEPGQEASFRAGVVWVPQFPVMFAGSLLYNIEYPMALRGVPRAERKKRAMELLDVVGLARLAKAPAHRLSGGESQRASIARAMAAGAEVILFDEPTANVDQRSLGDFVSLARDLRERDGLSLLVTTHNASLAADLCSRHIFLSEGKLVRQYALPGGMTAWPSRLALRDGRLAVFLPREAASLYLADDSGAAALSVEATVRGITQLAAGVSAHLEFASARVVDALLEDENSRNLARTLTLGSVVDVFTAERT